MKKRIIVAIIAVAVALPAGVYAGSPLFTNTIIDESTPFATDMVGVSRKTPIQDPGRGASQE